MSKNQMASGILSIEMDELETYIRLLTHQIGELPSNLEKGLSVGLEVFTLSEGIGISPGSMQTLWRHSVRTGYMAALIAMSQHVSRPLVWRAFIGGLLHDVGMLIFLNQQPEVFMAVVDLAQCQGQELGTIEKSFLGTTHAECGAKFLARWGVSEELLTLVTFHDKPFHVSHSAFCLSRLYILPTCWKGGGLHRMAMALSGGKAKRI
ncbi:MAG: HDOD domain-containing protein [Nitrospirota bacterium]|nr:MAG: HDOD domain-containing protein [Nitrospirota bacterium]